MLYEDIATSFPVFFIEEQTSILHGTHEMYIADQNLSARVRSNCSHR